MTNNTQRSVEIKRRKPLSEETKRKISIAMTKPYSKWRDPDFVRIAKREQQRKRRLNFPEKYNGYQKSYVERNYRDQKVVASRKLRRAVLDGKIIKPEHCSKCLTVLPKMKIQGHHDDYSKPYDVVWVCQSCHKEIHIKINDKKMGELSGKK